MTAASLCRRLVTVAGLGFLAVVTSAHVGSPDTWFEGEAGPYPVRVVIRLPGVIPGLAQIDVTTPAEGITRVTAQPVIFDAGPGGAPPPDPARPVAGRPGTYHAELWFMTVGSFRVNVTVTGARGSGTVAVPVTAVAVRQIGLYPWLGQLLAGLGLLLVVGAITIVRAAATDGILAPGQGVDPDGRRRGRMASVLGAGALGLALWGGRSWWMAVEREYRRELYTPFHAAAEVFTTTEGRALRFTITDSVWTRRRPENLSERYSVSPLVPDHGKLMHMYLIGRGENHGFAHLHPVSLDSTDFVVGLGDLPPGRYDVFADVVHESGFPETMVAEVDLPDGTGELGDIDDVTFMDEPMDSVARLSDGLSVVWDGRPAVLRADEDAGLRFVVRDSIGAIVSLEPYLGMAGHAAIRREDGAIYNHLHPSGTISAVAQRALLSHQATDTLPGMLARRLAHDSTAMAGMVPKGFAGRLAFPYAFPEAGTYGVWVQFRYRGQVRVAAFRATVR